MGKWIHRMSNYNASTVTADCANCGNDVPVRIRKGLPVCRVANKKQRNPYVRKAHGLTIAEAQIMRANNACAICGSTERLHVDHSHTTKEIRGVLCFHCNLGLGHFKDNTEYLAAAIKYLSE